MKKSIGILIIVAIIQIKTAPAQNKLIDSLKQSLRYEMPDTARSLALSRLGGLFMISKPDTALILAQQGLALARRIKYANGEVIGLNYAASIFNITGNYPLALEFFLEALKKSEAMNNPLRIGASYLNIGSVYYYQGDYRLAINYTLKARDIFEKAGHRLNQMTCLLNLGEYYEKWNKLDSARLHAHQTYEIALSLNDKDFTGMALNNLGNIYSKMKQDIIAMEFYKSGLPNLVSSGNDDALCECSLGMARLFLTMNYRDSLLYYARFSMATAQNGGFTNRVLSAGNFLSEYYRNNGMNDSAYHYLMITVQARDSLFSQEKSRQIQNLSFKEMIRQQVKEADAIAMKEERRVNIQYAIIIISLVGFSTLFLLLIRSIIVNEKWIKFLGILGLLLIFEFINLFMHPYIASATHHSPLGILLISVLVASVLVPLHHKAEKWITQKLVRKNQKLRLAAAKRTVAKLEGEIRNS